MQITKKDIIKTKIQYEKRGGKSPMAMKLTSAERQRRYRERVKMRAKKGEPHALELLQKNRTRTAQLRNRFFTVKSYIRLHCTLEEISELTALLQARKKQIQKGQNNP